MSTKNYTGQKLGYIEVLEKTDERKNGNVVYKCKCHKCGRVYNRTLCNLISRKNKGHNNMTCGCLNRHHNNFYKHGLSDEKLMYIYSNMKQRCYNKNNYGYKNYGGRGIKVCDEWLNNFKSFYDWSINNGYQDNLTIDRINNDGNYEPSNCKWSTKLEQVRNRRNTILITYNNETKTIKEWAEQYNIDFNTLRTRIRRGWDIERALNEKTHLNYKGKKTNEK